MVLGWPLLCKYGQFHLKFLLSTNYAIYYEYVLYIYILSVIFCGEKENLLIS